MATNPSGVIFQHVCQILMTPEAERLSDRELLRRFAQEHSEAAFATLVRRHGSLVLRVGRRVLHNDHDAEDVFQATFLVLARKAPSGHWHESVGPCPAFLVIAPPPSRRHAPVGRSTPSQLASPRRGRTIA